MMRLRYHVLLLCLGLSLFSAFATPANHQPIEEQAESGNVEAQLLLAQSYIESQKFAQAHYWLIKAALSGNTQAAFELGKMYQKDEDGLFHSLDLAENWLLIATDAQVKDADIAYAQVLETQFNLRRAKQVSAITTLDEKLDEDFYAASEQPSIPALHSENQILPEFRYTVSFLILWIFIGSIKRALHSRLRQKKEDLSNKLSQQNRRITHLQRQLSAAHSQINKQKFEKHNSQSNQTLAMAYALLGFQLGSTPSESQIKERYKRLSRIYHPDVNGRKDEMQRLNAAVKTVVTSIRKNNAQ